MMTVLNTYTINTILILSIIDWYRFLFVKDLLVDLQLVRMWILVYIRDHIDVVT